MNSLHPQNMNFLSDETVAVFKPHVKAIANERGCSPSYIYKILESEKNDPFPRFCDWYKACVLAGADVTPWDAKLSEIRQRYQLISGSYKTLVATIAEKLHLSADTVGKVTELLTDHELSEKDVAIINEAIQREENNLDHLRMLVRFRGQRIGTDKRKRAQNKMEAKRA